MAKGLVLRASKNSYQVFYQNKIFNCKASNKIFLKNENILSGDYVLFEKNDDFITEILPRKNQLIRPKISNVDVVFIVASYKEPDLSNFELTKLLLFYQYFDIEPIIFLTKKDLIEKNYQNQLIDEYKKIGYKVIESDYNNFNQEDIIKIIKNKIAILAGHSGVGKTTIVNMLNPDLKLKEGTLSLANKKGKHTTTTSTLFAIGKGFLSDTPGFAKLDHRLFKDTHKFARLFYDFKKYAINCKFNNCLHLNEKDCFIIKQVNFKISKTRYNIYIRLLNKIIKDAKDDYSPFASSR